MPASVASIVSCSTPERCSAEPRSVGVCVSVNHPYGLYVGHGAGTETYDLLVIPELEVVLHHLIFIPIDVPNHE